MTTKYVSYCSTSKPSCAFVPNAEIIICLEDSALVLQPDPPCDIPLSTIEAIICAASCYESGCNSKMYQYNFAYDDAQLEDIGRGLVTADISGFICRDCITTYIDQQISCAIAGLLLS